MQYEGLKKFSVFRQAEKKLRLRAALARWATQALLLLLALILLHSLIALPPAGRYFLLASALLFLLYSWLKHVQRPLADRFFHPNHPSLNSIALRIGRDYPELKDRLANALQISARAEEGEESASPELVNAVRAGIPSLLDGIDLSRHLDRVPARRWLRRLAAAAALFILVWLLFPKTLMIGLERTIYPRRDLSRQLALEFRVQPGDGTIVRGDPVTIRAWTETLLVEDLQIAIERFGRRELLPMTRGRNDTFSYVIPALRDSLYYQILYQKSASNKYLLRVVDLPMIRSLRLRLQPPSYSGGEPLLLEENIGDVSALKGTRIEWNAEANKPVAEASLRFSSGRSQPLNITGRHLSTNFILRAEESYYAELKDGKGLASENPIIYHLRLLADQYPFVRLLAPSGDVDLREDMRLALLIQAQDDYGLSGLTIGYQVVEENRTEIDSSRFNRIELPLGRQGQAIINVAYTWDLSASPLLPDQALVYYVEVRDNDTVSGPKAARTDLYRARFPSLYELYEEVNQAQDEAISGLEENYEQGLELKKKLDELALQLKRADELSWQKKQEVGDLLKQKEELKQELEEIAEHLDEMVEKMEENQLLSPETLNKYQELQELYRDIMTPELQKSMEKVAEAMQKIDPSQLQKALEEFKLTEEALNKSLDRTLSLLKRLRMEQQLDQAIRMNEDLQKREQELAEKAMQNQESGREKLGQEQEGLQQDLQKMEEAMDALQKEMGSQPGMPEEQMAAARDELAKAGMREQMEAMQRAIAQGNTGRMQESSERIQAGLEKSRQQLQQAKDALTGAMMERAMRALQRGTQSLLTLSQMQEELLRNSSGMPQTSARVPETAERQQQLSSSLERVINDLYAASKESFGISPRIGRALGQAQQSMQQALQGLENRDLGQAGQQQGQAMAGLNEAVLQMDAAMQSMAQGQGAGMSMSEFMQQMQQLADGQEGVNAQTLSLSGAGEALSLAQQAAMSRLAQQQGGIRKSMQQLASEASGLSDLLGDLEHIGDEMEKVEKELAGQRVNRSTIARQNRILSRMLDYQRSMREREQSQQRKAETGKEYHPSSPSELPGELGQRRDRLQQDLLRAKEEGYSRDYLELIRHYFESLGQREEKR